MRVAFINATGGRMLVDESRVEEYKAAGYMLAADVIDGDFREISDEPKPEPKKRTPKKAVNKEV